MGTNYYLKEDCCKTCGRSDKEIHIGKSSGGWCFALHIDKSEGINSLDDWEKRWGNDGSIIFDEYGDQIAPDKMLSIITERERSSGPPSKEFLKENHAIEGPNGLARSELSNHCTGYGSGTWDLIKGEFS